MHEFVPFQHQTISSTAASLSAISSSCLYGKGIFTTIAIYGGLPFLWENHWRRIENNAERLKIDLAKFSENKTKNSLLEIIEKNEISNGRSRLTFFDETESKIWGDGEVTKTSLSIITGDLRPIPESFRLTISSYTVNSLSPLAGIKSCNYLEKILALDEARNRGFDEAVQVNERGEITSGTMANVFWLKDNTLYTPSLKTGCLPGTTREFVMENLDCREVEETIDKLLVADAIFLTSAGLGVVQVGEFESRKLEPVDHPILDLLPKKK